MNLSLVDGQPCRDDAWNWSDVEHLLDVMAQLRSIVEEENEFLRGGLPSSRFGWREAKRDLADLYAEIAPRVAEELAEGLPLGPFDLRGLAEETLILKGLTEENLRLLDGAITATRRRIEATINAARVLQRTNGPYNGKAMPQLAHFVPNLSRLSA